MKKAVLTLAVIALVIAPVVAMACPYHQARGILNQLYGDMPGFQRTGPDQGGLNHYQMKISVDGSNELFHQNANSSRKIVEDVMDYVEENFEQPTYRG